MPTPKQMEKLAAKATVGRNAPRSPAIGPGDPMPPDYWQAVLDDASADTRTTADPIRTQRLCDVGRRLLWVACRRCGRTIEIQTADAVRLFGPDAIWKDAGQRLLDKSPPTSTRF